MVDVCGRSERARQPLASQVGDQNSKDEECGSFRSFPRGFMFFSGFSCFGWVVLVVFPDFWWFFQVLVPAFGVSDANTGSGVWLTSCNMATAALGGFLPKGVHIVDP